MTPAWTSGCDETVAGMDRQTSSIQPSVLEGMYTTVRQRRGIGSDAMGTRRGGEDDEKQRTCCVRTGP